MFTASRIPADSPTGLAQRPLFGDCISANGNPGVLLPVRFAAEDCCSVRRQIQLTGRSSGDAAETFTWSGPIPAVWHRWNIRRLAQAA